jgi:steroid 5-alpha reductase family enzyme
MTVLHLEAPAAMAVLLSVRMAGARMVQPRTGNAGWVNAIWTLSLGLARVTGIPSREPQLLRSRDHRYRDYPLRARQFFSLSPQDDPRKWRPVFQNGSCSEKGVVT